MKIAVFCSLMLLASCKSKKDIPQIDDRLVLLVEDAYFPVGTPELIVIKDAKTLNSFFSTVNKTRKPGIPVPKIDFSKDVVLIACMGKKSKEGQIVFNIETESPETVTINAKFVEKNNVLENFPFCVYKMERTSKEIVLDFQ